MRWFITATKVGVSGKKVGNNIPVRGKMQSNRRLLRKV
jgi:hypothetical protein